MDKHFSITKNKTFEIEFNHFEDWSWFYFVCKWTRKCDHAGFYFTAEVLGFSFSITICDNRHWDDENNKWFIYE